MSWNRTTLLRATEKDFVETAFGGDHQVMSPTIAPPFCCAAITYQWQIITVTVDKQLIIADAGKKLTKINNKVDEIAESVLVYCKRRQAVVATAVLNSGASLVSMILVYGDNLSTVLTWSECQEFAQEYKITMANRYNDQTWDNFMKSWNISDLPGLIYWDNEREGKAVFLSMGSLAEFALRDFKVTTIEEFSMCHPKLKWFFVFTAKAAIPSVATLKGSKQEALEKELYKTVEKPLLDVPFI
jgi:hypothetical protein